MADLEYAPPDPEHEALAGGIPDEWVRAAESWYSMHGHGLVRNLLAGAIPLIRAAERERIAALLDDLASASGGPSHFAYRNAAHLIRQERTDEGGNGG